MRRTQGKPCKYGCGAVLDPQESCDCQDEKIFDKIAEIGLPNLIKTKEIFRNEPHETHNRPV